MIYLVEAFRPRDGSPVRQIAARSVAAVRREGVRLVGRLAIPEDEVVFWLFEATSRVELATARAAAGFGNTRISVVVDLSFVPGLEFQAEGGAR